MNQPDTGRRPAETALSRRQPSVIGTCVAPSFFASGLARKNGEVSCVDLRKAARVAGAAAASAARPGTKAASAAEAQSRQKGWRRSGVHGVGFRNSDFRAEFWY